MRTFVIVLLFQSLLSFSQSDLELIINHFNAPDRISHEAHEHTEVNNDKEWMFQTETKNSFNPIELLFSGSMKLYQEVLSPQLGKRCGYGPSCSNFSKQSIQEFGIVKGLFLSTDRLLRCNRLSYLDLKAYKFTKQGYLDLPQMYRTKKAYEVSF